MLVLNKNAGDRGEAFGNGMDIKRGEQATPNKKITILAENVPLGLNKLSVVLFQLKINFAIPCGVGFISMLSRKLSPTWSPSTLIIITQNRCTGANVKSDGLAVAFQDYLDGLNFEDFHNFRKLVFSLLMPCQITYSKPYCEKIGQLALHVNKSIK